MCVLFDPVVVVALLWRWLASFGPSWDRLVTVFGRFLAGTLSFCLHSFLCLFVSLCVSFLALQNNASSLAEAGRGAIKYTTTSTCSTHKYLGSRFHVLATSKRLETMEFPTTQPTSPRGSRYIDTRTNDRNPALSAFLSP